MDRTSGYFPYIAHDEMVDFLSDKITASIFFKVYFLNFMKRFSTDECKHMIGDVASLDQALEDDTVWLAERLSGVSNGS